MKKKIILIIFVVLTALLASTLMWDYISLPYNNKNQIYGEYAKLKYNPLNDSLRYIFFVILPLGAFFISYKILYKENLLSIRELINIKNINSNNNEETKTLNFLFYLIIVLIIAAFFSIDFNNDYFYAKLDFYHEGTKLTPITNYQFKGGLWTSTFIEYGLFGNFYPIILNKIFKIISIGSIRFFDVTLLAFNNILLVLLSKKITESLTFNKNYKTYFFVFLSILSISLVDYKYTHTDINGKYFLVLIFLYVFFILIKSENNYFYPSFILGLFSTVSMFWYIDIGIYLNIFLILFLIYLLFRSEYLKIIFFLLGVFFSCLLIYVFLPTKEIVAFYETTKAIYLTINYIDGIIYPTPFISLDARSTRALIFIVITGILVIIFNFDRKTKVKPELKTFFSFVYLLNIITFSSAIVRSDSVHIKSAAGPLLFLLYSLILYFVFNYLIEKNKFESNYLLVKKVFRLLPAIILLINFFVITKYPISIKENIFLFKNKKFILQNDKFFLTTDQIQMLNYYNELTKNENCIQLFTNETAIPYLLGKPTCSKFYSMTMAASIESQNSFIKELKATKPKIILYDSDDSVFNDTQYRLPKVLNYIKSNYTFHSKFKSWTFFKLN